jgi:DNA adenine methylase
MFWEPFIGSGSVFLNLQPKKACLSDINPELINLWKVIRDQVEDLIEHLQQHAEGYQARQCDYYFEVRSRHPKQKNQQLALFDFKSEEMTDVERAARMKFLLSCSFNGLYRENSKGQFNVDCGKYKKPKICNAEELRQVSHLLRDIELRVQDFSAIEAEVQPGDFVYCDPPYIPVSDTSRFTQYSGDGFGWQDQLRLRDFAQRLIDRGVIVLLSNSDTITTREIYQSWSIVPVEVRRTISCNAETRGKTTELLIVPPAIATDSRDCPDASVDR